ncbi:hypothetical protein MHBO_002747 [Bonamia ostreae]|uniref:Uncharacterized protein n=1 Tax=Bonamia ostreae TaxID=126728 RepID=A0ABV2ANC9_9EUKA
MSKIKIFKKFERKICLKASKLAAGIPNTYLEGLAKDQNIYGDIETASNACFQDESCNGIVQIGDSFSLRKGTELLKSLSNEITFLKITCKERFSRNQFIV